MLFTLFQLVRVEYTFANTLTNTAYTQYAYIEFELLCLRLKSVLIQRVHHFTETYVSQLFYGYVG